MLKRLVILAIAACCMCEEGEKKWHFFGHEFDRTPLGDAVDMASMKLLKTMYGDAKDKNLIASPLGVLELLSMYSGGAGEDIKEEVIKVLGASNYNELYKSYTSLSEKFSSMDPDFFTLANKIFVDKKSELNEEFSTRIVPAYKSEVDKINFTDAQAAAEAINHWSDVKTKGHIKDAITPDTITPDVVAILANVIFFQGHWHVPFNASETKDKNFHVDKTTTVKKPMMHLKQSLFYRESEELGAKMIELPYKEKGFRMVIILPNEVDGLASVMEKAAQKGLLADIFNLEPAGQDILLDMPKFEFRSELDLKDILPKVGISKIFSESAGGIVKGLPVVVSKAFQKALIKVDEEGATAGAFTGLVAVPVSLLSTPPPPLIFKVDHPFLFAILHEDILLFIGTYSH